MKPRIIRADTIDLQDYSAPSAKDHSRQPTSPASLGEGPPAPHQAVALRKASLDSYEIHTRSPRASQDLSNKELQLLHDLEGDDDDSVDGEDGIGGSGAQDDDEEDEDEDGMDDDMMDKISSSPSIDDGGCDPSWPAREDSLRSVHTSASFSESFASTVPAFHSPSHCSPLPSPTPISLLLREQKFSSEDHHQGRYVEDYRDQGCEPDHTSSKGLATESRLSRFYEQFQEEQFQEDYERDFEEADLNGLLISPDDPLLDTSFDTASEASYGSNGVPSWDGHDDDPAGVSFDDPRFVDSGWGGECLREIEDIDFEFVYALHTFVATVEGQANATKGDTMVLLDDSNSYWWLVRIVKDSSIGYLPAEHIETPTERLARLNKHRNIDACQVYRHCDNLLTLQQLSQTMLGDNPEKSRNPLKKAMRRRNAKTVQFTEPTYFEPSDNEYSTEEEEEEEGGVLRVSNNVQEQQKENINISGDGTDVGAAGVRAATSGSQELHESGSQSEMVTQDQQAGDSGPGRKSRNTDSYKDDSVETKKISLTPSLLREDSTSSHTQDSRVSLESIEKPSLASKNDKRKEKKSGVLGGLFKRRNSKSKQFTEDNDTDALSKQIVSPRTPTQPKTSSDGISAESQSIPSSPQQVQPQRQTGRLQKTPPVKLVSSLKQSASREDPIVQKTNPASQDHGSTQLAAEPVSPILGSRKEAEHIMVTSPDDYKAPGNDPARPIETFRPLDTQTPTSPNGFKSRNLFSPIRTSPAQIKQVPTRMVIDEFDSSDSEPESSAAFSRPVQQQLMAKQASNRLSESPVQVSPLIYPVKPPTLVGDSTSQGAPSPPLSNISPASTPELIERPTDEHDYRTEHAREQTTPVSSSTTNVPQWSDAGLRAYLDNDMDVQDLLLVVHDTSDVKAPGPDHPVVRSFEPEKEQLAGMQSRLDGLLKNLMARRTGNVRS